MRAEASFWSKNSDETLLQSFKTGCIAAKTYLEITDRNLRTNGPHAMLRTTRKRYPEILCKYYSGCVKAQNKKAKKTKTNCDLRGFPTGTRHGQLKLQASDEATRLQTHNVSSSQLDATYEDRYDR